MKTETNAEKNLTNVGTIVFYRWHPFLPQTSKTLPSNISREELIEVSKSIQILHLSDDNLSDLIEFSEYGFDYKVDKKDYKEFLKTNYFDTKTRNLIDSSMDSDVLKNIWRYSFPTLSSEITEKKIDYYFGMFKVDSTQQSVLLIDVDGDTYEFNDGNEIVTKGIYKVEIYIDFINSNNSDYGGFIETNTLDYLNVKTTNIPSVIITLGPTPDLLNNSDDMYYYSNDIISLSRVRISDSEYHDLEQEISNRKVLYLIVSSDGTLESVNLSQTAWKRSPNPNRNQNKYSLRNDEFFETRDYVIPVKENSSYSNLIIDNTSGVLLGTKKLDIEKECPYLNLKINRSKNTFSPNTLYKEGSVVVVNGRSWESCISGNIGQDPEYSPYWILSESEDYSIGSPDYTFIYVLSNNISFGKITPSGTVTVKNDFSYVDLIIVPTVGYSFPIINELNDGSRIYSDLITINSKKASLSLIDRNNTTQHEDGMGNVTVNLRLLDIQPLDSIMIIFPEILTKLLFSYSVFNDWVQKNGQSTIYEGHNSLTNYGVFFEIESPIGNMIDTSEVEGYIDVQPKQSFRVTININNSSGYVIDSLVGMVDDTIIGEYEPTTTKVDSKLKSIFDIPTIDYIKAQFTINLTTKIFDCNVVSVIGAEVSKAGEYINYGQKFILNFYMQEGYIYNEKGIELYDNPELTGSPYKTGYEIDTTDLNNMILTIPVVKSNYYIKFNFSKL